MSAQEDLFTVELQPELSVTETVEMTTETAEPVVEPTPEAVAEVVEPTAEVAEPEAVAPEAEPEAVVPEAVVPEAEPEAVAPEVELEPEVPVNGFQALGLPEPIQTALDKVGYETPSPIQAATIPKLLTGCDLIGQAQTGTGKTAAFALPILANLDMDRREPQAIVLAPTRELAIQVAEAFQTYASHLPGFHVLPIYGGQPYPLQLRPLKRGVHVVVGTPGRVIDHLDRGSLDLSNVRHFVLDEADEMLNMGFVEDVDKILAKAPEERQIVLFSATMPPAVQRLAETYMTKPEVVRLEAKTKVADTIRQRYLIVKGHFKLDALTRMLEAETFEAMLIFVRTKADTVELSTKLEARGHACSPLNGDIPQSQRERTVERLKAGKLDIIVATDVAARGLDVDRLTHVVNYDMPTGIEPYTHRIGRTGRAGRQGEAILFVKPQERRLLRSIQHATDRELEEYMVPTNDEVNASRVERFKTRIIEGLKRERSETTKELYTRVMNEVVEQSGAEPGEVFGTLCEMVQGDRPLLFEEQGRQEGRERTQDERERFQQDRGNRFQRKDTRGNFERRDNRGNYDRNDNRGKHDRREFGKFDRKDFTSRNDSRGSDNRGQFERKDFGNKFDRNDSRPKFDRKDFGARNDNRGQFERKEFGNKFDRKDFGSRNDNRGQFERKEFGNKFDRNDSRGKFDRPSANRPAPSQRTEPGMTRYKLEVGKAHGAQPGSIVGAIANEGDISSEFIGRIEIHDLHSTIDLPDGMPPETFKRLQRTRVRGQQLRISPYGSDGGSYSGGNKFPGSRNHR